MTTSTETSVRTSVTVEAPVERAFEIFTKDMKSWWPPEHHILASELVDTVVEPQPGGAIYDVGADGSTCRWGTVVAYEPPARFAFQWNINLQWQIELDPAKTSEVDVRFVAENASTTVVELQHRHLDRHGDGWETMRDAVGSPEGWALGLGRFVHYLTTGSPD
jgi:uncharacterized protein YndB with AHSA1/START domain